MVKDNFVLDVKYSDVSTTYPVTLEEAKNWCKIELDITEEDDLITELIKSATALCEGYINTSLMPKTVTAELNNSLGGISLPYAPVTSFTSLKDEDDTTLVETTDYILQGLDFKTIKTPCYEYLKAEYVAGYAAADLPPNFKTAILQQIVYLYENRGDIDSGKAMPELSPILKLTLKPYRRVW